MSFLVKANNDWVNFTTMYAQVDQENPNFMLKATQAFDNLKGDLGLICGNFNKTLVTKFDRFGYSSDKNRKCCSDILNWIESGELIDAVRCFHPDSHLYSWRTKNLKQKERIDYLLMTVQA